MLKNLHRYFPFTITEADFSKNFIHLADQDQIISLNLRDSIFPLKQLKFMESTAQFKSEKDAQLRWWLHRQSSLYLTHMQQRSNLHQPISNPKCLKTQINYPNSGRN